MVDIYPEHWAILCLPQLSQLHLFHLPSSCHFPRQLGRGARVNLLHHSNNSTVPLDITAVVHRASRLVTMKANGVRQFHRWKSSQNLWSNFALQMRKQKINNIIWLVQGHRTSYGWRWADNLDLLTLCNQFLPFTFQIFLKGLQYQDRYCHYKHIELCVKRSMWTTVRKNERKTENNVREKNSNLRTEFICQEHSKMHCQFCLFQNALK